MSHPPPDNTKKPILSAAVDKPVDGSTLSLTCSLNNPAVTKFEFFKNGKSLSAAGSSSTYKVSAATFSNAGSYTCKAYIKTVKTAPSDPVVVTGIQV